jgi:hypothetical protein
MGHAGMLANYPDTKVEKPCDGECTLLWQQPGLEYPNGTNGKLLPAPPSCLILAERVTDTGFYVQQT